MLPKRTVVVIPTIVAITVLLLGAGCAAGQRPVAAGGLPAVLNGRTFLSVGVAEDGVPRTLVDGTRVQLRFDGGRLSASAGCNQLSGAYQLDGTSIVIGELAMTEMACLPAERMAQDTWLAELLTGRPTVSLTANTLVLTAGPTVITLLDREAADPNRPLVGPQWTVQTLFRDDVAMTSAWPEPAYLVFDGAGRVSGFTGCNQLAGRYTLAGPAGTVGATITFSQVSVTKKACAGPAAELERLVTAVFTEHPVPYQIEARTLRLTYWDGSGGLELVTAG